MLERAEEVALSELSLHLKGIWTMVSQRMDNKSKAWIGISDKQVRKRVKYVAHKLMVMIYFVF